MKKILVTSNIKYDKYGNLQNLISQDWFQFLNRLGFSAFTTGIINDKQIKSELTKINGVIFSGGNDLFSVNKKRENLLRDNYEKKLFCHFVYKNLYLILFLLVKFYLENISLIKYELLIQIILFYLKKEEK